MTLPHPPFLANFVFDVFYIKDMNGKQIKWLTLPENRKYYEIHKHQIFIEKAKSKEFENLKTKII